MALWNMESLPATKLKLFFWGTNNRLRPTCVVVGAQAKSEINENGEEQMEKVAPEVILRTMSVSLHLAHR